MRNIAAFVAALLLAAPAGAELPGGSSLLESSPQYQGLRARYRVLDVRETDLDGDGLREWVVALGPSRAKRPRGGFAVIAFRGARWQLLWAGIFENSRPESLSIDGPKILARVVTPAGPARVELAHGRDFWFREYKESPFRDAQVKASSTAKGALAAEYAPKHVVDGDPTTVWCPATIGTGVGEWVQLEFARPVDLGFCGVIGGDYRSAKQWKDANRIFRFDLVAETEADRTTIVEDTDITSLLQLPTMGKRVSVVAKDARRHKFAEVRKRHVVGLKVEVASVYLGDESNDVFVSEVECGELLADPKPEPIAAPAAAPSPPTPSAGVLP